MDITRVVLEMIENRVSKKFEEAAKIVSEHNEKIEKARKDDEKWVKELAEKIAKEAQAKFEKEVKAKFPKAIWQNYTYSTTPCFDAEPGRTNLNASYPKELSYGDLRSDVLEKCKQIAIENGPKTAFGEIDKYLETVDPVKILKLSK